MEKLQGQNIDRLPLCGVLSVSIASKNSLSETFDTFKKLNKKANNWKGRTNHKERLKVLKHYKVKCKDFRLGKITLKNFTDQHTVKGKMYMITTTEYIQIVQDGMITDQRGTKPISEYWGKDKRLNHIQLEII
jgi:hypothetical protein